MISELLGRIQTRIQCSAPPPPPHPTTPTPRSSWLLPPHTGFPRERHTGREWKGRQGQPASLWPTPVPPPCAGIELSSKEWVCHRKAWKILRVPSWGIARRPYLSLEDRPEHRDVNTGMSHGLWRCDSIVCTCTWEICIAPAVTFEDFPPFHLRRRNSARGHVSFNSRSSSSHCGCHHL